MLNKYIDKYVILQTLIVIAMIWAAVVDHVHMATIVWAFGVLVFVAGFLIMGFAFLELGSSFTPVATPLEGGRLVTTGLYGFVRHPMYFGGILIAFGWSIFWGSLIGILLSFALGIIVDLKSKAEEKKLVHKYPEYIAYKAKVVRKLIPYIY